MVICLEWGATDLHMVQPMLMTQCHLIISCFNKIQTGSTFLVLAYPDGSGKEAVKWLSIILFCGPDTKFSNSRKGQKCVCVCDQMPFMWYPLRDCKFNSSRSLFLYRRQCNTTKTTAIPSGIHGNKIPYFQSFKHSSTQLLEIVWWRVSLYTLATNNSMVKQTEI